MSAESATNPSSSSILPALTNPGNSLQHFSTLSIKEVQQLAGRKLKLKEKIAVKFFQWKIKKGFTSTKEEPKKDKGKTAMIFGIIGLASLLIPVIGGLSFVICTILALVLGYQAKKENPEDTKAKTAIILGWVGVGLFVVGMAVLLVALVSWGGWGWG